MQRPSHVFNQHQVLNVKQRGARNNTLVRMSARPCACSGKTAGACARAILFRSILPTANSAQHELAGHGSLPRVLQMSSPDDPPTPPAMRDRPGDREETDDSDKLGDLDVDAGEALWEAKTATARGNSDIADYWWTRWEEEDEKQREEAEAEDSKSKRDESGWPWARRKQTGRSQIADSISQIGNRGPRAGGRRFWIAKCESRVGS